MWAFACTAAAADFSLGGKVVHVPAPSGFVKVTPEMDGVYRMSLQVADPINDQLGFYIAEADAANARKGDATQLERTFGLKVHKQLREVLMGSNEFQSMTRDLKEENKRVFDEVKAKASEEIRKTSKGISKEFDIEFAMQVSDVTPLDPHHEEAFSFAYSMYINYAIETVGIDERMMVAATSTVINASGKVLFLYCYAPKDQLEWTRTASKEWAAAILAVNPPPPLLPGGLRGGSGDEFLEKMVIGAVVFGVIGLAISLRHRRKKGPVI